MEEAVKTSSTFATSSGKAATRTLRPFPNVYNIGGRTNSASVTPQFEAFNILTGDREPLAPLNQHRRRFDGVELRLGNGLSEIMVFGGIDLKDNLLQSIETYSPQSNTWTVDPNFQLEAPCCSFCAVNFSSNIFIIGGDEKDQTVDKVRYFQVKAN